MQDAQADGPLALHPQAVRGVTGNGASRARLSPPTRPASPHVPDLSAPQGSNSIFTALLIHQPLGALFSWHRAWT